MERGIYLHHSAHATTPLKTLTPILFSPTFNQIRMRQLMRCQFAAANNEIKHGSEPMGNRNDNEPGDFTCVIGFVVRAIDQHPNPKCRQGQDDHREENKTAQECCEF